MTDQEIHEHYPNCPLAIRVIEMAQTEAGTSLADTMEASASWGIMSLEDWMKAIRSGIKNVQREHEIKAALLYQIETQDFRRYVAGKLGMM
jgi:hypothetical protein